MTRDLMYSDEIQDLVHDSYSALDTPDGPAETLYEDAQLAALPEGARKWALGVGNPVQHAGIESGDDIVDLGSGAGIDVLLAARETGPTGSVVGVDFLSSMGDLARGFADEAGIENATFVQSEMEDLPLPDESADMVISNGAINLSGRKSRVLAEAHRVLRPGGRFCVADLTIIDENLPPEIITHPSAWAG